MKKVSAVRSSHLHSWFTLGVGFCFLFFNEQQVFLLEGGRNGIIYSTLWTKISAKKHSFMQTNREGWSRGIAADLGNINLSVALRHHFLPFQHYFNIIVNKHGNNKIYKQEEQQINNQKGNLLMFYLNSERRFIKLLCALQCLSCKLVWLLCLSVVKE